MERGQRARSAVARSTEAATATCPRWAIALGVVVLLVPLVASAVVLLVEVGGGYRPTGDHALIELRTRDVGTFEVLTGLYSRDGWNHPGPALFYLLALPYLLSGGASISLPLGALLLNGAALTGIVVIAARRGGAALLLCSLVGSALLVRTLGPEHLKDVWNPYLPVLPFALLLFLVWSVTCGRTWALPSAAAVASFVAQTHVGYLPLAVPLLAIGGVALVVRLRGQVRTLVGPALVALAVLTVFWLPPMVDQIRGSPGNLGEIARYFRSEENETRTFADGYRVVASQFEASPEWLRGPQEANSFSGEPRALRSTAVPVLLVPLVAAGLLAWRRRARAPLALVLLVSSASVIGLISVARTIGPLYAYRLRWTWVLGVVAAVAAAWIGWTALGPRAPVVARRALGAVLVAGTMALTAVSTADALHSDVPQERLSRSLAELLPPVRRAMPNARGAVIVRTDETFVAYGHGLVLQLERAGINAKVDSDPAAGDALGRHRLHRRGSVRAVVEVVTGEQLDGLIRGGVPLTAYAGDRSLWERATLLRRADRLAAARAEGRLSDRAYVDRQLALGRQLGTAVGVIVE